MPQGLLSRTEAMNYLGCDDPTFQELIRSKKLTLYKIAGEYERFNKADVIRLKQKVVAEPPREGRGVGERLLDFWQYNNFYIITSVTVGAVVFYFFF